MLVDQEVKKFMEFLPCTLAVYDCRQLEDVSSIENVHMVTKISSFYQVHAVKGPLYKSSYLFLS